MPLFKLLLEECTKVYFEYGYVKKVFKVIHAQKEFSDKCFVEDACFQCKYLNFGVLDNSIRTDHSHQLESLFIRAKFEAFWEDFKSNW